MPMTPEVLLRLEGFGAVRAGDGPTGGVGALVKAYGRGVLEPLATDATGAVVGVAVAVEVVLLEMDLELEADVTRLTAVWAVSAQRWKISISE